MHRERLKQIKLKKEVIKKFCKVCGSELGKYRSAYCSEECSLIADNKSKSRIITEKKSVKPKLSISEICKLALAEHLSYGKYVAKYKL